MSKLKTKRDKILETILLLRGKNTDNGATEAEAMTAFNLANKLMESYQIAEADLAMAEASGKFVFDIVTDKADVSAMVRKAGKSGQRHKVIMAISSIANFTGTKGIYGISGHISYTGHRPDVELAKYLTSVIRNALDYEYDNFRRRARATGYGAKNSFQMAMVLRVANRLEEMEYENFRRQKADSVQAQLEHSTTSSSTALVLMLEAKEQEVSDAYRKAFPNATKSSRFSGGRNYTAQGEGRKAGNNLNLGRAIGQGNGLKRLA